MARLETDLLDDQPPAPAGPPGPAVTIRAARNFIRALEEVTSAGDHSGTGIVSAADADAIVARSALIRRLGSAEPALVTGGIDRRRQFWISAGKPPWVPAPDPVLSAQRFVAAAHLGPSRHVNPFGAGLYTSSGFAGTQGMWRLYLDLGDYSANCPPPWHVWRAEVSPAARVRDVTTAAEWEELILRYPAVRGGLIYPDWRALAEDTDGVHLTIRAIAALQGLRIRTPRGLAAPGYWDVETTFWLNWAVAEAELAEVADGPSG